VTLEMSDIIWCNITHLFKSIVSATATSTSSSAMAMAERPLELGDFKGDCQFQAKF